MKFDVYSKERKISLMDIGRIKDARAVRHPALTGARRPQVTVKNAKDLERMVPEVVDLRVSLHLNLPRTK